MGLGIRRLGVCGVSGVSTVVILGRIEESVDTRIWVWISFWRSVFVRGSGEGGFVGLGDIFVFLKERR